MPNLQPSLPGTPEPSSTTAGSASAPPSLNSEVQSARPDPFDPESLRTGAPADVEVEHVLTTVPVRKPKRTEFFRVHPGQDYTVDTYLLERDTGMAKSPIWCSPRSNTSCSQSSGKCACSR